MRTYLAVETVPQVPSINFWWRNGGQTSELGADSTEVSVRGIEDERGRLVVLMTHNTDMQDTWEREADRSAPPCRQTPARVGWPDG